MTEQLSMPPKSIHVAVNGKISLFFMVEIFCWCGKPLQYSCLENPMNSMKRQKDKTLKDELPRSVGAQYAPGEEWKNNSRKNGEMEPKQKQHPVVDVTGDGSKV